MHHLLTVLLYCALGCAGMAVQDIGGTFLNLAENHGAEDEAGNLDMLCDAAKFLMFSFSGEHLLKLGGLGWAGIVPILLTGRYATKYATRWSNRRYQKGAAGDSGK